MKLKVTTFNLYQFVEPPYAWYNKKDTFSPKQWQEKTRWIKAQILKMDCDIIGFQEVFSRDALEELVKEVGFNYFVTVDNAQVSIHDSQKFITTTVALASKYPITNIKKVKVHQASLEKHLFTETFAFSRVPIKATIELPNQQEILVYVCHLKSNRLNEFEYIFRKEHTLEHKKSLVLKALEEGHSKALKQRLCEASSLFYDLKTSQSRPTVLLCDLNDKEFSLTIDAMTNPNYHDEKSNESYLLEDACYHYDETPSNPHPEQKKPERKPTSYFQGQGHVLDYVFVSQHL
ncbi:MAG TPA: endonuclease, partial [Campylobacterales bacterium]|nr:endonuclease [Campylobacterales bacterium]